MNYETIKQLAKERRQRINDLLALAPKNDPFYTGTPSERAKGEWFAGIYNRAGFSTSRPPHLRRVHYWIVSQDPPILMTNGKPYENTIQCWEYLIEAGKAARYLELVAMAGIVDNKNPRPHVYASYGSNQPSYDIDAPDLTDPYIWVNGINDTTAQPYHLEVWCEKSTMNDVLLPVLQRYNANLVTFEGEVSITSVCVDLMRRLDESGGKPARIFYISDFDPAGNSMPVAMARKVEYALYSDGLDYDVKVKPLALTAAQVARYRLPRIPIKETEKRAGKFEAAFGTGAVELDALEALYPGVLAGMVDAALSTYYSRVAAQDASNKEDALRQAVSARVSAITARYAPQIAALQAMIDELRKVDVDTDQYRVETHDPHVEESDDWLFDSERSYLRQIAAYKAHKAGSTSDDDAA